METTVPVAVLINTSTVSSTLIRGAVLTFCWEDSMLLQQEGGTTVFLLLLLLYSRWVGHELLLLHI